MTKMERGTAFGLASTSIWCLLAEFYGLCPMRVFTLAVFLPATVVLAVLAVVRRWQEVWLGALAGLLATMSYDVFRIPFVCWAGMPLFKVFPMFGAMILGGPATTPAAHTVGWIYHFSNGITFGVMFAMMVGVEFRRRWWWAVVFAMGLELTMLFTPYPTVFAIKVTAVFVSVTMAAHLVFGVTMGWSGRWLAARAGVATG